MKRIVCGVAFILSICLYITSSALWFLFATTYWDWGSQQTIASLQDKIQALEQDRVKQGQCEGKPRFAKNWFWKSNDL